VFSKTKFVFIFKKEIGDNEEQHWTMVSSGLVTPYSPVSWSALGSISSTYLCAVFMTVAPQSVRTQSSCQYLFTLLGSTCIKVVHKQVGEINPRCQFHQHSMRSSYTQRSHKCKKYNQAEVFFVLL